MSVIDAMVPRLKAEGSVKAIGLDIATTTFQVPGIDGEGEIVLRRRLTR